MVAWDGLPPPVQEVLTSLRPSWSSKPVEVDGATYLFQVVEWIEAQESATLASMREELHDERRRQKINFLLARLRAEYQVRLVPENIPFAYLSESPAE